MVGALIDTNILIDFLSGVADARAELARQPDAAISTITWMEVMVGATPTTELTVRAFLAKFALVEVDQRVAEEAVSIRRTLQLNLPDAIILACARTSGRVLVTRNTRDFDANDPGIRVPYR